MTIEIEDPALARFIAGPAPYSSGNAVPEERPSYPTAQQELAAALEGQGPRLSKDLAELLGPARTAELAQVIRRAVAVGIKRRADQEVAERLAGAYDLLVTGLDQVTDGCTTPEDETDRPADEALHLCGVPTFRDFVCARFRPCPIHEAADRG